MDVRPLLATVLFVVSASAGAQSLKTFQKQTFGCLTESAYRDTGSYLKNREEQLFTKQFTDGKCVIFKEGDQVVLVDVKFMEYAVVRRRNTGEKYFTYPSLLK